MNGQQLIGKEMEYEAIGNGDKLTRKARIVKIEHHEGLNKTVYTGITSYNNTVRLTLDEITRFIDENGEELPV